MSKQPLWLLGALDSMGEKSDCGPWRVLKLPVSFSAPGVGRQTDVPIEESQLLLVPAPRTPRTPRGVLPTGGKGLTSDLPGSPNQPQAVGSPGCSPGREPLASLPAGPPPATDRLSSAHRGPFIADHPGPGTRLRFRFRAVVKRRV